MTNPKVLGIETSCDETAAAVVDSDGVVYSDVVASQIAEHAPYGGVVPELAARAHLRAIVPVVQRALEPIEGGLEGIDAIAVTRGPGLVGALIVGAQLAKTLAWSSGLPVVGVNHLDGHLLAARLQSDVARPELPFVALLASGGHTALYRVDAYDDVTMLGQTRDDAAGEAFDKAAKLLGLGYPGGPIIDRLAGSAEARVDFPLPMASKKTLDFSFSGLKTSVARYVERNSPSEEELPAICAGFQHSVVSVLARKSVIACQREGLDRLVLCGGVAANRGLRARTAKLASDADVALFVPPVRACTDNAAMIAYVGALYAADGRYDENVAVYSRDPQRRRGKFRRDGSLVKRE